MTQEEKDLLLKDLCGRLPYEPIVEYVLKAFGGGNATMTCTLDTIHLEDLLQDSEDLVHIKPYLRTMSSMTEEEVKEFYDVECMDAKVGYIKPAWNWHFTVNGIDWLNAHHFDYRGLIDKGLAIEITEEFNPYKD